MSPFIFSGHAIDPGLTPVYRRGGGGDPFFANVFLLLPMVGASATSLQDKSSRGHNTWTFQGNSVTSSGQSKFAPPSLSIITPSPRMVHGPDSGDWDLPGDFTIEAHVRLRTLPTGTDATILAHWAFPFSWNARIAAASMDLQWSTNGVGVTGTGNKIYVGGDTVIDVWNHYAWCRDGNNFRCFREGIQAGITTVSADTFFLSAADIMMGASDTGSSNPLAGWIDNVRLTVGVARYTANFTPPTAEYPES